jgi:hypothetical protein
MPLLARQEQKRKADEIAHANAPQQMSEPRHRRPYLLKTLQDGLGTRVLADTLDWDGEFLFCPRALAGRRPWRCSVPWGIVRKI